MLSRIPGNFSLLWRRLIKTSAGSEQSESVRHQNQQKIESLFASAKHQVPDFLSDSLGPAPIPASRQPCDWSAAI